MKKEGYADMPLHNGRVPMWLAQRMRKLAGPILESVITEYGKSAVLQRLSDPLWFQSFGCVLGMDWHSSGITTSVMGAIKSAINPISKELGIYVCGGRGKHSKQTPRELMTIADNTGMDGLHLVKCSKLSAKTDNSLIQDGYQLYLHSFILTDQGDWAVVQQGMNSKNGYARRYHWLSQSVQSFVESPHTDICGKNEGMILNLTDVQAGRTRQGLLNLVHEHPNIMQREIKKVFMPRHHEVRSSNVNLKRLGSMLALAHDYNPKDFESLVLLQGVGPRTIQSLALVSEVIYGTPTRFQDPARFSFAHGGKDGHPFPVPLKIYDETIEILNHAVTKAKLDRSEKQRAIRSLFSITKNIESNFIPNRQFDKMVAGERRRSYLYGGQTVMGKAEPPSPQKVGLKSNQLSLFEV